MNTYSGLHARNYDVLYADKPYAEEARFVDALLNSAGVASGALLDVACDQDATPASSLHSDGR